MADTFLLDPHIEADSLPVTALAVSDLRLMDDARFPWLLLVPRRTGLAEIIDLDAAGRALLFDEIIAVSEALKTVTGCHKLNVAALGNVVRQLHVHVIARFETDAAWPRPVWGVGERVAYEAASRDSLIARIRAALPA
jgi:diadenosine tetraphosphate (Ap4A) HIT family hydrolase